MLRAKGNADERNTKLRVVRSDVESLQALAQHFTDAQPAEGPAIIDERRERLPEGKCVA